MNFFFFHVGENDFYPKMMVSSIKFHHPEAKIFQVSDYDTKQIDFVTNCYRFNGNKHHLMKFRIDAYSNIPIDTKSENIFLDTDMLLIQKLDLKKFFHKNETLFCERFYNRDNLVNISLHNLDMLEYKDQTMAQAWPFLGSFIVTKNNNFFKELSEIYCQLEEKYMFWYGDQIALKKYFSIHKKSISIASESIYSHLPNKNKYENYAKILHFKGQKKTFMELFYKNLINY